MQKNLTDTNGEVHLYMVRSGEDRVLVDPDPIPTDAFGLVTIESISTVEDFWNAYSRLIDKQ